MNDSFAISQNFLIIIDNIKILDCAPSYEFNHFSNLHGVKTKIAIKSDDENIQCIAAEKLGQMRENICDFD